MQTYVSCAATDEYRCYKSSRLVVCVGDIERWMLCNWLNVNADKTELIRPGMRQELLKSTWHHNKSAVNSSDAEQSPWSRRHHRQWRLMRRTLSEAIFTISGSCTTSDGPLSIQVHRTHSSYIHHQLHWLLQRCSLWVTRCLQTASDWLLWRGSALLSKVHQHVPLNDTHSSVSEVSVLWIQSMEHSSTSLTWCFDQQAKSLLLQAHVIGSVNIYLKRTKWER